jgi:hypothetical protein
MAIASRAPAIWCCVRVRRATAIPFLGGSRFGCRRDARVSVANDASADCAAIVGIGASPAVNWMSLVGSLGSVQGSRLREPSRSVQRAGPVPPRAVERPDAPIPSMTAKSGSAADAVRADDGEPLVRESASAASTGLRAHLRAGARDAGPIRAVHDEGRPSRAGLRISMKPGVG